MNATTPDPQTPELPPLQIVCVGAGRTGKTTVARMVSEQLGIELVPSVARDVQAEFGITTEDAQWTMSPVKRWEMQQEISRCTNALLTEKLESGQPFISDRSPLDHLAYALMKSRHEMTREWLEAFETQAVTIMNRCTLVAYFPMNIFEPPPDEQDGAYVRTGSYIERANHDLLVQGFISDWKEPHTSGAPPFTLMHCEARSIENRVRHMVDLSKQILEEQAEQTALEAVQGEAAPLNPETVG